jgi:hypothetical protein
LGCVIIASIALAYGLWSAPNVWTMGLHVKGRFGGLFGTSSSGSMNACMRDGVMVP